MRAFVRNDVSEVRGFGRQRDRLRVIGESESPLNFAENINLTLVVDATALKRWSSHSGSRPHGESAMARFFIKQIETDPIPAPGDSTAGHLKAA